VAGVLVIGAAAGTLVGHAVWQASEPRSSAGTDNNGFPFPPEGGNGFGNFPGGGLPGGDPFGSGTSNSNASDGPTDAAAIARGVDPGLVDITTTLSDGTAAGTGMVLTSTGEVLTNNHVIDGARSISVRDVGNGKTYHATVVGYDRSQDIAVLQLTGASGLTTITPAGSEPSNGAAVVGVGNAGGTGGTPSYAGGAITDTNASVSASDEYDGTSERLTGLLATDADIQAGDSGGPLVNAAGQVVGMDTAASAGDGLNGFGISSGSGDHGYAIPISTVLRIASEIEAGRSSATVHVGPTAALGVYAQTNHYGSGVEIAGTTSGGAAEKAGLGQGDVITDVNGTTVDSLNALTTLMSQLAPGQQVQVAYTDSSGSRHSVNLTLGSGPPQ
jgi:S1-C subfamily serine protease